LIDSRLFPLLETLSIAGLDWLVLDILEVVTTGEVELEGADALARARDFVKLGREQRSDDALRFQSPRRREWLPDEQVRLAAEIALQRIEEVVTMSESSLGTIASLIGSGGAEQSPESVDRIAFAIDEGEMGGAMSAESLRVARESLGALRYAVESWLFRALLPGEAT